MSVSPQRMSIQSLYRLYRDGSLTINRPSAQAGMDGGGEAKADRQSAWMSFHTALKVISWLVRGWVSSLFLCLL